MTITKALVRATLGKTLDGLASFVDLQPRYFYQRGILRYENDEVSGEAHLIRRVLPTLLRDEHPVLFDVGANTGRYSGALLRQFPSARVVAFEPAQANFEKLQAQFAVCENVVCRQIALGETAGMLQLYDYADSTASSHASLYRDVITSLHGAEKTSTVTVAVSTLDDVVSDLDLSRMDFLKIDTEGHELAVLQGGTRTLQRLQPTAIQFEFNEMNVVSRTFLRDFYALLNNYALFRLLPKALLSLGAYSTTNEIFKFQNVLAVRQDRQADVQQFQQKLRRL